MKKFYRVMLGKKSVHATECFDDKGAIGFQEYLSINLSMF
jgi:hypothetical protein